MRLLARPLGRLAVLSACLSLAPLGCSSASASFNGPPSPPGTAPEAGSVSFDDPSTLTLPWGATQSISVTVTPPGTYRVGFSLVGIFDSTFDGSLSQAVVVTGSDGRATVSLHAPSESTTFDVRASVLDPSGGAGASAAREVSVSQQGFGTIQVSPTYAGNRTISTWTALVVANTTCAAVEAGAPGALPADPQGAIAGYAPLGSDLLVDMAPVGPNLAVLVRAGHYAWGCADASMLTAGSTLDVPVSVFNVPLDLSDADLPTTFTYTPDPTAYATVLGDAVTALVDAFMPEGSPEGTIVLNGMAAATTDPTTFAIQRVAESWDASAGAYFASLPKSLRATCSDWATTGTGLQPYAFQATLAGGPGGALTLDVAQFGNLPASAAGATAAPGATWTGLPDDSVQLTATLSWEPSRFAGAASFAPASAATGAATVAAALSAKADCHGLAAVLGPFGTCDLACVEALCGTAIESRWTTALGASKSASALGQVVIQGSGKATVGDLAEPISLTGAWQGQVGDATAQVPLKGGTVDGATVQPGN